MSTTEISSHEEHLRAARKHAHWLTEIDEWKAKCPIRRLRAKLIRRKVLTAKAADGVPSSSWADAAMRLVEPAERQLTLLLLRVGQRSVYYEVGGIA